ncbi:MAG: hypothetical protein AABW73_01840 [Nanoarchaeota archaeon]
MELKLLGKMDERGNENLYINGSGKDPIEARGVAEKVRLSIIDRLDKGGIDTPLRISETVYCEVYEIFPRVVSDRPKALFFHAPSEYEVLMKVSEASLDNKPYRLVRCQITEMLDLTEEQRTALMDNPAESLHYGTEY